MEEILSEAWNLFKVHWKFLIIAAGIAIVVPFVLVGIPYMLLFGQAAIGSQPSSGVMLFIVIGYLISVVVSTVVSMGLIKTCTMIVKGQTPTTKDMILSGSEYLRLIGAGFLIGIGTAIGSIFCIIPGLIFGFLSILAIFIVLDEPQTGVIDAIKKSIHIVKAYWKDIVIILLILVVINCIASSTGIGVIVSMPFCLLAETLLYVKYKNKFENGDTANNSVPPAQPTLPPEQQL